MTQYQRHVLGQMLIAVNGWFSLCYGWGLEVKNWHILLAWGMLLSVGLAPMQGWIARGRKPE